MINSKINDQINLMNFDQVGKRIGEIIFIELNNQKDLETFDDDFSVYYERITPIGNDEDVVVNILPISGSTGSKQTSDQETSVVYYIDIYSIGKETPSVSGSYSSSSKISRFISYIQYILNFPEYKILGFDFGMIAGGGVEGWEIQEPSFDQNSDFSRFGRITLSYKIQEKFDFIDGVPLMENHTNILLDLTEKGYKFIKKQLYNE